MISNKFLGQDLHLQHDEDSCREKLLNEQYNKQCPHDKTNTFITCISCVCGCTLGCQKTLGVSLSKIMCLSATLFW